MTNDADPNVIPEEILEALASGREDLVEASWLERVAADPALREQVARARALSLDVGLLLDEEHPPVDVGAMVHRAIQSAPPVVEARALRRAGFFAIASTIGFGLLSLPRLPGWSDLMRAAQLTRSLGSSFAAAVERLPVGAGFGAACVCIAITLLVWRSASRRSARGSAALLLLLAVSAIPNLSEAQRFVGDWSDDEEVSVDAEDEARSAVLREAAEDADLNFVSHIQSDPRITVHVDDVPLRVFLSVALAGEEDITVERRDGMVVLLPSDRVSNAAPSAPVAPAPAVPTPPSDPEGASDRFSMGDDVHLAAGETVRGLVTMGGDAVVDGVVLDDCITMGGDVEVRGVIYGDLFSMGGDIHIYEGGQVHGEVGAMGGEITNDSPAGQIRISDDCDLEEEAHPARDFFRRASRHGVIFLLGLILLGAFQSRHARLCQAVISSPIRTAISGAGGFFAALVMTIALAVTIIGIPLSILTVLLTTVSVYFGFAVVASVLGALLPVPKWQGRPLVQLAAGVGLLFVLSSIPVVSFFADIFAACIGLGAVVYTRFGRPEGD